MRIALGLVAVLALVIAIPFVTGCGGGGDVVDPQGNTITGKVDTAGGAEYDVLLDGKPVPGAMRGDSYVIEGVPPGDHRVAVVERGTNSGGYVSVQVRDGQDSAAPDIAPELGGQIVGMVTVDGNAGIRALGGVEVVAVRSDLARPAHDEIQPAVYPPIPLPKFNTFTEDDGSYRIPAVPEGEYTVTVALPDYEQSWQWVWVGVGQTAAADFRLRRAIDPGVGTVEGRITETGNKAGEPIEGVMVTIFSDAPWQPIGPICPPGGRCTGDNPGVDPDGGPSDKPEAPAPPENIDAMPAPWFDGVSTLTDADGRYSLNAPAGHASIEAWAPHYEPVWEEITIEADQTKTRNFSLEKWQEFPYPGSPPPAPGPDEPPVEEE